MCNVVYFLVPKPKAAVPSVVPAPGSSSNVPARPALGSQITIQSEQEKQLKKFYMKQEKKMARQVKGLQAAGVDDHETQLQLLGYNPEELRKER